MPAGKITALPKALNSSTAITLQWIVLISGIDHVLGLKPEHYCWCLHWYVESCLLPFCNWVYVMLSQASIGINKLTFLWTGIQRKQSELVAMQRVAKAGGTWAAQGQIPARWGRATSGCIWRRVAANDVARCCASAYRLFGASTFVRSYAKDST